MALKITTQISTDKGTTSQAYVRITEYTVSKLGHSYFKLQTFLSESEATLYGTPDPSKTALNYQIGENLFVPLTTTGETPAEIVPDLTPVETGSIFAFGYAQLKTKLQTTFGETNVIDC